ncbi:hypothetical protein SDC9_129713 [bioreactor metagenome]|uniref:Uncharacterized protein n=1 Tax=bioreactor metagenome TaxID=1076179 RepID=A0A645D0L2_9ZZZZ
MQQAVLVDMSHVAHRHPVAVAQHAGAVHVVADIVHEQHGAAQIDEACLAVIRRVFAARLGDRQRADRQRHVAERTAHGRGGRVAVGIHPGDVAGLGCAIELHDARVRKQRLERWSLRTHPARAADLDKLHTANGRQLALLRPLQHQQQLAGHGHQHRCAVFRQPLQAAQRREFLLHHGARAAPQAMHHAEQKQRMRHTARREHALGGHCAKVRDAHAKALGP